MGRIERKNSVSGVIRRYTQTNLILRIIIGLVIGIGLGIAFPSASAPAVPGTLFVSALKSAAPILVLLLVSSSLSNGQSRADRRFVFVIFEYLFSTFAAALTAVLFSFIFPVTLTLSGETAEVQNVSADIGETIRELLVGMLSDPTTAVILLSLLSSLAACGASGVAGGSLLMVPTACSLFGISSDTAMQVVAIGFVISVIQDSMETALNSSGDVLFTAAAEYRHWIKTGKSLPEFLGGETKADI